MLKGGIVAGLLVLAVVGAVLLSGCASADQAAAERANAEAAAERAAAESYARQVQADTAAAAERSAIRQSERDAAHQRALEMLPFVLVVAGVIMAGLLFVLVYLDIRSRPVAQMAPPVQQAPALPAPSVTVLLLTPPPDRGRADYWRQVSELAAGDEGKRAVTVYRDMGVE